MFFKSQGPSPATPRTSEHTEQEGPFPERSSTFFHPVPTHRRARLRVTLAGGVPEGATSCTCACRPLHSPRPQATVGDGPLVICFPALAAVSVRAGPRRPWPPLCFQG